MTRVRDASVPLYLKVARQIEGQIRKGALRVGDKVPSIRGMRRQQRVNAYGSAATFANGMAMRAPPAGTLSREDFVLGDSVVGLVVNEFLYRKFTSLREGELTKMMGRTVVVTGATGAQGGGVSRQLLLSGKYRRGQPLPEGSRFADQTNPNRSERLVEQVFDVVEQLEPIAQSKDCTLVQLAVAWVLNQPGISSPIIGPRTMPQLEEYLGSMSVTLTPADLEAIDRLVPPGGMVSPFYQADFGPHPYRVL